MGWLVIALTNMERMYVYGTVMGLSRELLDALVRLAAGYTVERARVSKRVAAAEALASAMQLTPQISTHSRRQGSRAERYGLLGVN